MSPALTSARLHGKLGACAIAACLHLANPLCRRCCHVACQGDAT